MSVFKKVTAIISAVLASLLVTLFCVLFTAPGNQLLAYAANKWVDGLTIEIKNGRFLYNDAFNVRFEQNGLGVNAQQLKIDLFWWQCNGLCIDNLSAKSIKLTLPQSAENKNDTPTAALEKITLPFNIALKNLAIDEFILNHSSANVALNTLQLSAKAEGSDVTIKRLAIPRINVALKAQTADQKAAANQQTTPAINELPALPDIDFTSPLNINVEQLSITNVTINQGEQHYSIDDIALQMSVENATINVQSLSAGYQQWQLNTQLDATLKGATALNGNIRLQGNEHGATLNINGDLAKLNVTLDTTGLFPLNLKATANLKQKNYPFSVNGKINQWLINTQNNELKVKNVNLNAQGNANDYQLSLTGKTQLDTYPSVDLNAQLKGTLTKATLETLALKANDSAANIQAHLDWQQGIKADFSGVLANLKAQYLTDALSSDISGTFKGVFNAQADTWQLQMNKTKLAGLLNNVPLAFAANFKLDNQLKADIDSVYLSSGANKLALNGRVDDTWQVDGDITLNSDEQASLPFIANGKADLKVRGNRLTPSVDLAVMLERFIFNDININKLAVKSQLDMAADWQTDLSVNVASALIAGQQINNINIAASGDKTDHQLSASVDAEKGAVALELTGKMKNAIWNGELSDISLTDKKLRFNNTKKISVMVNTQNGDFDVSAHCWQSAQSKLCIDTLLQVKALGQFNAQLTNLSLAELNHLLPDNIRTRGELTGDFAANWQSGALKTLRANVNSSGLNAILTSEEARFKLPIETLSISAFSDAQVGMIEANLASSVLGKIATAINIDDIQNTQTLSGNVTIDNILLSDIQPFLDTLEQLKGTISGQIALAGTLKDPQLNGELNITDINLEGTRLPVALKNSDINVLFNKTTATIKGDLNDPQGGQIKLVGDVDWQGEYPAFTIDMQGSEFFVRAQQGVDFKVSPALKMHFTDNALELTGNIVVPYGRIEIETLPAGAVQVSDDEIIIDETVITAKKVPFNYNVELKVIVNNDVRVASFGLGSKVVGDMEIKLNSGSPIIAIGELNLVDGTYLAFGQDLIISTGQIGFSGAIDKPYLNIKAIRNPNNTADGVIAGVTLTGGVDQPSLNVFSEPAMDQAQALAYLLNGQPLTEGDSSTDAMLTQLLLSQGVSRSEGIVSKLGETFGLSDVSLSSKGSGDQTKVEISGYLAPSLQVKYSVGVFDSLSEVAVRYQLLSKLYIEITSGLYQNVDVLYKFNWD